MGAPKFVDTHCHVEYVMQKMRMSSAAPMLKQCSQQAPNFEACLSNFCDPAALSPSFGVWRDLLDAEDGAVVYGCFGIHPHNAKYYTTDVEGRLLECLQHPRAVAVGECGLDYHAMKSTKPEQEAGMISLTVSVG